MSTELPPTAERTTELRAAVRFPLSVPISLSTEGGEIAAQTVNISANGVLFELTKALRVGSTVSFVIQMPAEAMGTPTDVVVNCAGRVVRCAEIKAENNKSWHAAAVIDKYYFSH